MNINYEQYKYFNDYADNNGSHYKFQNLFVKQKDLCEKYQRLQPNGINNLTLRLCLVQSAFCHLFERTLVVRQKTREDYKFGHYITGSATSGIASVHASPTGVSLGESFDICLHDVHQYFYSFCTFAVGVLDRLAVEIRECYGLFEIPETKIDWGYYFEKGNNNKWKSVINQNIYKILNDQKNNFKILRDKRNVLTHRNFFEIEPGEGGFQFDYIIEGNIGLTNFMKSQFEEILLLCNDAYKAIYDDGSLTNFVFPIHNSKVEVERE